MRQQITERLAQLRGEYTNGQKLLDDLEARRRELRDTMLRIGGAMQVLEEELAKAESLPAAPPAHLANGTLPHSAHGDLVTEAPA